MPAVMTATVAPLDTKLFAELHLLAPPDFNDEEDRAAIAIQSAWRGQKERLVVCTICYSTCRPEDTCSIGAKCKTRVDPITQVNRLVYGTCGHSFCKSCCTQYLTLAIRDGKAHDSLKCPHDGCGAIVSPLAIDQLCEVKTRELYSHVGAKQQNVARSPLGRFCPTCNDFIERFDNSSRKVECKKCDKVFCAKCSKPYHYLTPCDDVSFKAWSLVKNVKRCPKCDFYIEKNGGCQHMCCSRCQHSFCWTCMAPQNKCNNVFCQGNIMNHSLFGTSRPVYYVTRGVAGAVALPVVVAAGAVAGTAFVTIEGGKRAKKAYKKRQRQRRRRKVFVPKQKKIMEGFGPKDAARLLKEKANTQAVSRVKISEAMEVETSLVLLKRQLQNLQDRADNELGLSVGAKWQFVKNVFKGDLSHVVTMFDSLCSKNCKFLTCHNSSNNSSNPRFMTSSKRRVLERLKIDVGELICVLMVMLTDAATDLSTIKEDAALNPITTYKYTKSTDTYAASVKTDVTSLLPQIQAMLPEFIENNKKKGGRDSRPRCLSFLQRLLVDSGINPPIYIQQIFFIFFKLNQGGIDEIILVWFKSVRKQVEREYGVPLEWLLSQSWIYNVAQDSWTNFPRLYPGSPYLSAETGQQLARHCLGAIIFHHDDLVAQTTVVKSDSGNDGQIVDLFSVQDLLVDDLIAIPKIAQMQQALTQPFAFGCMLQYVSSRKQAKFNFQFETNSPPMFKKGLGTDEDILTTLHFALSLIYDSSLAPYPRAMCFRLIHVIVNQIGIEAKYGSKKFPSSPSVNSRTECLNSNCSTLAKDGRDYCSAHQHLEGWTPPHLRAQLEISTPTSPAASNTVEGGFSTQENVISWISIFQKIAEACLAIMTYERRFPVVNSASGWLWLLPCACGCFHSIFQEARAILWLSGSDLDSGISGVGGVQLGYSRRESIQKRQKASETARDLLLKVVLDGFQISERQLRLLHKDLKHRKSETKSSGYIDVLRNARNCVKKMYQQQEWFFLEKDGVAFYASFDGEVQRKPPANYAVAWKVYTEPGKLGWLQNDQWIVKKFPMLAPYYYVNSQKLSDIMEADGS